MVDAEPLGGVVMKRHLLVATLAVGLLLMPIKSAVATNAGVIPASSSAYGQTYGEWGAAWWEWALSQPIEANPVLDTTGAACANGQRTRSVWFLAGTFDASDATRSCTVPAGRPLFFPIVNAVVSTVDVPGGDEAVLREAVESIMDDATALAATIDGEPIDDLSEFRVQSPLFAFTLPTDNLLGAAAGTYEGVSEGFYLMLTPLPVGTHTIHFEGALPTFGFSLDVSYTITVSN